MNEMDYVVMMIVIIVKNEREKKVRYRMRLYKKDMEERIIEIMEMKDVEKVERGREGIVEI